MGCLSKLTSQPLAPELPNCILSHLHAVGLPRPCLTVGENADTVAPEAGQHSRLQLPEDLGVQGVWKGPKPEVRELDHNLIPLGGDWL